MAKKAKKQKTATSGSAIPRTDRQFEVRNAADTLIQAGLIRADRKLMQPVQVELRKREKAIKKATKG